MSLPLSLEEQNRVQTLDLVNPKPDPPTPSPPIGLAILVFIYQVYYNTLGRLFPKQAAVSAYNLFTTPRIRARHSRPDALIQQATVSEFTSRGISLKAYSWGSGEQRILLAHGWESRGTALRYYVSVLVEKGFQVLAIDAPAHGDSSGKQVNMVYYAQAIADANKHFGGFYGVIGHSFGGSSAIFAWAALLPHELLPKLVVISIPHDMKLVIDQFLDRMRLPQGVRKTFYRYISQLTGVQPDEIHLGKAGQKANIQNILIVHDTEDRSVPFSSAQTLLQAWPQARLLASTGWGHFRLVKHPDIIKTIGEFMIS